MRRPNRGRAMPRSPGEVHVFGVVTSRFEKLPITFGHAERVTRRLPHRMPIAQALDERLVPVTHDRKLAPYSADILCA